MPIRKAVFSAGILA
uniref:Uncharacterized protein n=1 Tax=Anguilla anguilla TaxID=7936 RepID=A0A0E9UL47_ANGAN